MRNVVEYVISAKDATAAAISSSIGRLRDLVKSTVSNLANIKAGWDMLSGTVSTIAKHLASTVQEAFKFETITLQFAVLMRSMDDAKARMKELADFAAATPFNLEGIAKASRTLHVFSGGALGARGSLELVGDAAAAVGISIEDLSFWIGRAYSAIKGGQPFGEAAMRLQEMGVMTPDVRKKMEDLQAAGASNIEVWNVLQGRLLEFSGGMEKLSKSGDGLVSTLQDNWVAALRKFGGSFVDASKNGITYLINQLDKLTNDGTIERWAERVKNIMFSVAGAIKGVYEGGQMRTDAWDGIKDVFVGALELGASKATSLMMDAAPKIGALIGSAVKSMAESVISPVKERDMRRQAAKSLGLGDKAGYFGGDGDLTEQEKLAVSARVREMKLMRDMADAGFSDTYGKKTDSGQDRIERGLSKLRSLISSAEAKTDFGSFEKSTSGPSDAVKKDQQKVIADMAKMQVLNDQKRAEETQKKEKERLAKEASDRLEIEKKLNEERIKLQRKELDDRIKGVGDQIKQEESQKTALNSRLAAAQAQIQKAWGWYRDKDSLKRQMDEEKQQKEAEKRFEKEWVRLATRRSDWRTAKNLSVDDEAVRRLGLAKEEEKSAQKSLANIDANTKDLHKKLDELVSLKGAS